MALHHDPPGVEGVYRLILKIFEYAKNFSREYKRAPGHDLKRDTIVLVRMTTTAGVSNAIGFAVKRKGRAAADKRRGARRTLWAGSLRLLRPVAVRQSAAPAPAPRLRRAGPRPGRLSAGGSTAPSGS